MDYSLKILEKLFSIEKDSLGIEHYKALWHGYQLVKEQFPELSQEDYKQEIANLRMQHFIEVENISENTSGVLDGRILATPIGIEYYFENKNKGKIGFI